LDSLLLVSMTLLTYPEEEEEEMKTLFFLPCDFHHPWLVQGDEIYSILILKTKKRNRMQ
jgi:hypothetical protein